MSLKLTYDVFKLAFILVCFNSYKCLKLTYDVFKYA